MKKFLVIQQNSDGRPCGWGQSADLDAAKVEAERQWSMHGHPAGSWCYPGEKMGELVVHEVEDERNVDLAVVTKLAHVQVEAAAQAARPTIPRDAPIGLLCRHRRASGFKLAVVIGYPTLEHSSKLRVRFWRAASKVWTQPTLRSREDLAPLTDTQRLKHARTIERATTAASAFLKGAGRRTQ